MSAGRRHRLLLALALLSLSGLGAGCDSFFTIEGVLLDCATAAPIAGAKVVSTSDPGTGSDDTETTTTDAQGHFEAELSQPRDEGGTVTFSKPGYLTLSNDFKNGLPSEQFKADFCLQAAPP